MRAYFDLLLLAIVVVYIVDVSGVVVSLKSALSKWLYGKADMRMKPIRPFDCSLCMIWWVGIVYMIIVGECSLLLLAWVAMLSAMSTRIHRAIQFLQDAADALIDYLTSKLYGHGK